ncbi:zinc/cadmium/mercury/lead-transporting ATPase [Yersinia ruckeri]|uniref:zinc/cadmium/mercury/lead-transporting ATPase n=1 Tax=Yersinia ruckeri TaxID=29486 RepID=UPI0022386478|nr:zinc/cadmium/mercury/lead-transporting ATPase [Yersinia ruckeri]MCW6543495.1 zinc/cadmium/mercury/lead-transporting ATPase [Yersinia ruckeri]MCW6591952.1 zinc/cadmium/mercury/lead-transporting ATPase [Yersinia ruckeri]UZX91567.1 zinc/cadmium/mercury/lead-transporting ATPase [Yersinia ruckeri]
MHSHHDHKQQNSTHRHESEKHAHTAQKTCCSNSADDSLNTAPLAADHQRYSWQIKGMDCPSCARKVETAVGNLSGVEQVKVLFATEKLVVDAKSDIRQQVQDAVTRVGFSLVNTVGASGQQSPAAEQKFREYFPLIILTTLMVLSWVASLFSPEMGRIAFIITTLVGLVPIVSKAWKLTRSGTPFAIETLMSVAAIGALFIGATAEAAMVLLLFMLGELLESYAAGRARRGVSALMALVPEEALLLTEGQRRRVPVASLRPGDVIEIAPGARLPADAKLVTAFASFDESALTGESIPVERQQGEKVAAGSLSVDRAAQMQVVSEPGNNAIDRILQLIERAEERRAPIERFIDRFSRIYTPLIMLLSVLVILIPPIFYAQSWDIWIYRGLTLLLIGCPCALVISTPAAITSALAAATRRGALIKGGAALEQLGLIQTVAFDKTGTLTEGKPQVTDVLPVDGMTERRLIALAAAVEAGSHHPLATAILQRATQDSPDLPLANERRALAGIGVEGVVDGLKILVSSPGKLAAQTLDSHWQTQLDQLESSGKTAIAVLENDRFIGLLALRDTLRSDAKAAINALKKIGIQGVMLTGDNPRAAAAIAYELGIDYRAGLLPADKVEAVTALNQQQPTVMVGDGINDAPAMKAASIGVAMGSGTDVALETADAALTHNRLTGLAEIIVLSRAARANIRQNIAIALGLKGIFLVTTLLGLTGLWLAVLADSGATALVTANALRLLRKRDL